ncbi:phage holin family protein [Vallitalea pronyensis]|uniref:Phage holin family protein n=1 Tax=Vallitalea pronyensis TaxID=1348613 RepID=A0A8J8MNW4_9FIRM|nr:phage holin family protein [Vallitalea pronyensis]QUI24862.1 phage holin family protein [Vallitalea pronyensis]
MDWNIIIEFIRPELLILIAICYCMGLFLKVIPKVPDWTIPLVLLVFTCCVSILYIAIQLKEGFNASTYLMGFIYGVLSAAVAVYGNQVIKQLKNK